MQQRYMAHVWSAFVLVNLLSLVPLTVLRSTHYKQSSADASVALHTRIYYDCVVRLLKTVDLVYTHTFCTARCF
jgi:hypothetical protein